MTDIQEIPFTTIDGQPSSLGDLAGNVVLVVNVASKCGLTPQYEALESLYEAKRDEGFTILGFPANDFMGQEPGTDEEIVEFCTSTYDVQFPLASKISVVGDDQHPLYKQLTSTIPHAEGDPEAFRCAAAGLQDRHDRRSRHPVELREVPRRQGRHRRAPLRARR